MQDIKELKDEELKKVSGGNGTPYQYLVQALNESGISDAHKQEIKSVLDTNGQEAAFNYIYDLQDKYPGTGWVPLLETFKV